MCSEDNERDERIMKAAEMPRFGILQGIKVINCASVIAGPFSCGLFSDNGAEVIHLESALGMDLLRNFGKSYSMEHRNQRNLSLNWVMPEGKEILFKLLQDADILIESSKAGSWDKWGLTDDVLWDINPDLVIVHVSGYGQTGDPDYVSLPAYDMVGQAFGGYLALNGMPNPAPPLPSKPYTCDYFTGFMAAWSALAALLRARETGKGESIDVAMYEAIARVQAGNAIEGFTHGKQPPRTGTGDPTGANDVLYKTKDNAWLVLTGLFNDKLISLLDLNGDPDFAAPVGFIRRNEPRAEKFLKAVTKFVGERESNELVGIFSGIGVGCSMVMTYDKMVSHPHYLARESVLEWFDPISNENVKGIGVFPKFQNNPGQVFRGSPTYGMDNEDILTELGYSEDEIKNLYEKSVLNKE